MGALTRRVLERPPQAERYLPSSSFCVRENPELGAPPRPPGTPGGALKLSREGNWKGSDTGTSPPSMPYPRGSVGGLPTRPPPATDDTWGKGEWGRGGGTERVTSDGYDCSRTINIRKKT